GLAIFGLPTTARAAPTTAAAILFGHGLVDVQAADIELGLRQGHDHRSAVLAVALAWPLAPDLGVSRAVIRRPSIARGRSNLLASASFSRIRSRIRRPSSWCCISRPRNRTVTSTLSWRSRNLRAWLTLTSTSCSPVLGRTRISFTFGWRTLPPLLPFFCEFSKRILP